MQQSLLRNFLYSEVEKTGCLHYALAAITIRIYNSTDIGKVLQNRILNCIRIDSAVALPGGLDDFLLAAPQCSEGFQWFKRGVNHVVVWYHNNFDTNTIEVGISKALLYLAKSSSRVNPKLYKLAKAKSFVVQVNIYSIKVLITGLYDCNNFPREAAASMLLVGGKKRAA